MKTFNKSDLITWVNREKANTYENYYFANSISDMQKYINNDKSIHMLIEIDDNCVQHPFRADEYVRYACILPESKVIEKEPEKKYRACMDIKELYELVNNSNCKMSDEECIYQLIRDDYIIHIRNKNTGKEYYSKIASIIKDEEEYILFTAAGYSLLDLFNTFDIEINGEWQPFGVLDEN